MTTSGRGAARRVRSLGPLGLGIGLLGVGALVTPACGPPGPTAALVPSTTTTPTTSPSSPKDDGAPPAVAPSPSVVAPMATVGRPAPVGASAPVTLAPSPPVGLRIDRIGVQTPLDPLDLDADGAVAAPADVDHAGWFVRGPQPGQPGPALIAGHVDSATGPAVFVRLAALTAGDRIAVDRADGTTATFVVDAVGRYPKAAFPSAAVYGPVPVPALRLVTCGGAFDRASGHYLDNVVVFATLADD